MRWFPVEWIQRISKLILIWQVQFPRRYIISIPLTMAWIAAVYNIPGEFDSFSLREFFDHKDALELFHFKNRPESSLRQLVQKYFPNVTLEGGVESETSDAEPSNPSHTSSTITVDFQSMILEKSKKSTASTSSSTSKPTLLVAPPNTKSAFIKVKGERLTSFTERYHRRPWRNQTSSPAVSDQCCFVTPLARENGKPFNGWWS